MSEVSGLLSAVMLEQPDDEVEPEFVCVTSGTALQQGSVEIIWTAVASVGLGSQQSSPKTKLADGLPLLDEKLAVL